MAARLEELDTVPAQWKEESNCPLLEAAVLEHFQYWPGYFAQEM